MTFSVTMPALGESVTEGTVTRWLKAIGDSVAADEALTQANWHPVAVKDQERTATIIASGGGGFGAIAEAIRTTDSRGPRRLSPFTAPSFLANMAAGQVSIRHGFKGPLGAQVTACAAGVQAIGDAARLIRSGEADIAICGGTEAAIDRVTLGCFAAARALSTGFNDSPQEASRPFDRDRDGFVMGEGAGMLVLESLEHALQRGAKIYCEIAGGGATADAHHITAPHPEGLGAKNVMTVALKDAGLQPSDIDYINVHGTSTPLGDIAETKAIMSVFGEHAYNLNISSTKSMTGHCLGAAGALEAIACVMSVVHDIIPPTINHFTDDPELDPKLNFTFNKAQKRTVRAALSNTFGFGGHNASVIVKKYS